MRNEVLYLIAALMLLGGCSNQPSSGKENLAASEDAGIKPDAGPHCFASKTKAYNRDGDQYNYEFIRLTFGENDKVDGVIHVYPYGTDAVKGSLSGVYRQENKEVVTEATLLSEGQRYKENRDYRLLDNAIDLGYTGSDNQPATLPRVSCEAYDALFRESQLNRLRNLINTTDRTRLLRAEAVKARGYSAEELSSLRFLERQVDLDNNWETQEFLLYVIDPTYCGTGGCDLFVINEEGETLSSISVVKLPVYATVQTAEEDPEKKGAWKELFVWSQGLRRLVPAEGKYPGNASMEPVESEELMSAHPEYYEVLLDYLE